MRLHLFKDWQYLKTISGNDTSMLNALASLQYRNATFTRSMFTVLSPDEGYAFSQWYEREVPTKDGEPPRARHGIMFKHERGQINPDAPSYDELLRVAEVAGTGGQLYSIYTRKSGHQVISIRPGESLTDYCKRTYNDPHDQPFVYRMVAEAQDWH